MSAARLLGAVHALRQMETHVWLAVDDDDPELDQYQALFKKHSGEEDSLEVGPRKGLTAWTNHIATWQAGEYDYLASFGDDHRPRTPGFDLALADGIKAMGGTGFTYPWDGVREDIPEAVVMSSDIVTALGWMCLPSLEHYYIDNVWGQLGRAAGCIRHLRAIAVDHIHPAAGTAPADATYAAASEKLHADRAAYWHWRRKKMAEDVETIVSLRKEKVPQPA